MEPVQGEGGINSTSLEFLQALRALCDEKDALLVFDEVQCGVGRTGKLWAHEHFGVTPDMFTVAKPLANGLPVGAVLVNSKVADCMEYGDHGSTFAGNPLVTSVASYVLGRINTPDFLSEVTRKGKVLRSGLTELVTDSSTSSKVVEVRSIGGLIAGVQLAPDVDLNAVVNGAAERGLIIPPSGNNTVRIVPPLVISDDEIAEGVSILKETIRSL